jgi:hypothetical protein
MKGPHDTGDCGNWHHCADCGSCDEGLKLVAADLGEGAFLAVLCPVCWHRRQYKADLLKRLHQ